MKSGFMWLGRIVPALFRARRQVGAHSLASSIAGRLASLAAVFLAFAAAGFPDRCVFGQTNQAPIAALHVRADSADAGFITLPSNPAPVYPMAVAPRPGYLVPANDVLFGTPFMRIANDSGAAYPAGVVDGTWGSDSRHHYSKDQPWNSDGTLIAIQNNTSPHVLFLDGETYQVKFGECENYPRDDDRWHPVYPHIRINVKHDELMWWDVVTCTKVRSWTLPFSPKHIGDGEGAPSHNGRFIALCDSARMFVVDMDPKPPYAPYPAQRIGPVYDYIADSGLPSPRLGWVAVSPSGKYLVCKYGGDYPRVFDIDPMTLALTPRPMSPSTPLCEGDPAKGFIYGLGHCDMALNPFDGDEDVLIGQEHCDWRGTVVNGQLIGGVMMARLRDGAITALTDPTNESYPHHISTRNVENPGWAYVGYYPYLGNRFADEIVAVKLDGSKAVRRFIQKHSDTSDDCYRCEAHAVPSPDGRRVMWASNWALNCSPCGSKSEIKSYIVDARDAAVEINGTAPFAVVLDAGRTRDSDGLDRTYRFDYGNGTFSALQFVPRFKHTYATGEWTARVIVTDEMGAADTATALIHVTAPPLPPVVSSPATVEARSNETVTIHVTAMDPNNESIAWIGADLSGLPAGNGASFTSSSDHTSGTLSWTPTVSDSGGVYTVTFTASNTSVSQASTSIHVSAPLNRATNPSFETASTAGWTNYSGSTFTRVSGGWDGDWSLHVQGPDSLLAFGINDSPAWISNIPAAGTSYHISAWVRSSTHSGTAKIRVREYLNGVLQNGPIYSNASVLSPTWKTLSVDYAAVVAGSFLDIQVLDYPVVPREEFDVDLVSIYERPTAALVAGVADRHGRKALEASLAPNPLSSSGTLSFTLPEAGPVRLSVFDVNGREVSRVLDGAWMEGGRHRLRIGSLGAHGERLPAGIYLYRIGTTAGSATGRFALIR
jgi:hypothetical protein